MVQQKCGHTNYIKHINMNNIKQCKIKKERKKENRSNANTVICFEVRATALRSRLHTEEFSLCTHRTFHKGTSTEDLQLNTESTQLLSHTQTPYTRGRHKAKAKKRLQLDDPNDHKLSW